MILFANISEQHLEWKFSPDIFTMDLEWGNISEGKVDQNWSCNYHYTITPQGLQFFKNKRRSRSAAGIYSSWDLRVFLLNYASFHLLSLNSAISPSFWGKQFFSWGTVFDLCVSRISFLIVVLYIDFFIIICLPKEAKNICLHHLGNWAPVFQFHLHFTERSYPNMTQDLNAV